MIIQPTPPKKLVLLIFILTCMVFIVSTVIAEEALVLTKEQKDAVYETAENFADCGAAYEAFSILIKEDRPNLSVTTHELGLGAAASGAWTLASLGVIKDWQAAQGFVNERRNSEKTHWLALLEDIKSPNWNSSFDDLTQEIQLCQDVYGELQGQNIKALRRWLYTNSSSNKEE